MSRYLDMVDGPEHVKKLTMPQLQVLAEEIRHEPNEPAYFLGAVVNGVTTYGGLAPARVE